MSAKRPVPAPCRQQDSNRPVPPSPPVPRVYDHENQQLRTTVAELRAENERLRERVRELAKGYLRSLLSIVVEREGTTETKVWIAIHPVSNAPGSVSDVLLQLAEEAGVWFDDQGNEVPLAEWLARMGGETA